MRLRGPQYSPRVKKKGAEKKDDDYAATTKGEREREKERKAERKREIKEESAGCAREKEESNISRLSRLANAACTLMLIRVCVPIYITCRVARSFASVAVGN